ncbi:unnamed protein product, partial [Sphagnum jensenii]
MDDKLRVSDYTKIEKMPINEVNESDFEVENEQKLKNLKQIKDENVDVFQPLNEKQGNESSAEKLTPEMKAGIDSIEDNTKLDINDQISDNLQNDKQSEGIQIKKKRKNKKKGKKRKENANASNEETDNRKSEAQEFFRTNSNEERAVERKDSSTDIPSNETEFITKNEEIINKYDINQNPSATKYQKEEIKDTNGSKVEITEPTENTSNESLLSDDQKSGEKFTEAIKVIDFANEGNFEISNEPTNSLKSNENRILDRSEESTERQTEESVIKNKLDPQISKTFDSKPINEKVVENNMNECLIISENDSKDKTIIEMNENRLKNISISDQSIPEEQQKIESHENVREITLNKNENKEVVNDENNKEIVGNKAQLQVLIDDSVRLQAAYPGGNAEHILEQQNIVVEHWTALQEKVLIRKEQLQQSYQLQRFIAS